MREQQGICWSCHCILLSHKPLFVFPTFPVSPVPRNRAPGITSHMWAPGSFHSQSPSDNILLSGREAKSSVFGLMPKVDMSSPNSQTKKMWHTHMAWQELCQTQRDDSRQLGSLNMLGKARGSFLRWALQGSPHTWEVLGCSDKPHFCLSTSSLALSLSLSLSFPPVLS